MPKRRPAPPVLAALLCLAAGGCATSSSDPASLIPTQLQATVMAEDRLLGNPSGGGAVSVDEMLARARQGGEGTPGQSAAAPATGAAPGETTGSIGAPAAAPAATTATAPRPASVPAAPPPEPAEPKPIFEITFDGTEEEPAGLVKEALAKKIKGSRLSAKSEVTILTGPGPGTNAFEQAVLANKRARNVRSLLPEGWQIQQVYDPSFPPDTVRIVLGRVS
ncbi:MAG: hypothetical protein AB1698_21635 [Pseudomonadota bacterium]